MVLIKHLPGNNFIFQKVALNERRWGKRCVGGGTIDGYGQCHSLQFAVKDESKKNEWCGQHIAVQIQEQNNFMVKIFPIFFFSFSVCWFLYFCSVQRYINSWMKKCNNFRSVENKLAQFKFNLFDWIEIRKNTKVQCSVFSSHYLSIIYS